MLWSADSDSTRSRNDWPVVPRRRPYRRESTGRRVRRVLTVAISSMGTVVAAYAAGIRINLTSSMPPGLYQITHSPVVRGAIVLVCLPDSVSAFARARRFVPNGSCTDRSAPIGKTVAAIGGDTVDVASTGITVNGRALANSRPLLHDSQNRPLPTLPHGRYIVGAAELWLVSSYSGRSFDSRYFGAVPVDRVIARVRRIVSRR